MKPLYVAILVIVQLSVTAMRVQPQGTASAIDTSKWKTYRNDKSGFEMKYPDTWSVHAGAGIGPEIISLTKPSRPGEPSASLTLAIQPNQNPEKYSIEEWFAGRLKQLKARPDSSGRLKVSGQPAMFMENSNSFGIRHDIFTLLHVTDVLSLSYARQPQFDPIYAAMVASIRLLK